MNKSNVKKIILIILLLLLIGGFYFFAFSHKPITQNTSTLKKPSGTMQLSKGHRMKITSNAFAEKQSIPTQYTCDGKSTNPPLSFSDVPANAKSLVLLMDDPNVPKNLKPDGMFDHWVIYNIEPTVKELSENSTPPGAQGLNGTGKPGYFGPCPPDREHRYFFRLYALDARLDFADPTKVTKQMVEEKMQGHILDEAELVGLYNRPQNK